MATTGISFIHLDSLNQSYNVDNSKSTFAYNNTNKSLCPNAYNCNYILNYPIQNYSKFYLKSMETGILFPNIRASSKLNTLTLVCTGGTKTITLPDKQYVDINTLITDLNSYGTAQYPSDFFIFSISTNTNSGNIMITSSANASITMAYSNLAYILGFRPLTDSLSANTLVASYRYNLGFDTYLNVVISNVYSGHTPNTNGIICSYKVGINASGGSIQFNSENLGFSQFITLSSPKNIISMINVQIYDRWGYSLHSNGADLTMTLALTN